MGTKIPVSLTHMLLAMNDITETKHGKSVMAAHEAETMKPKSHAIKLSQELRALRNC